MSEVSFQIGGRKYSVSCADGQEKQLRDLAGRLDQVVTAVSASRPLPEGLALVIGSLILCSELSDKIESGKTEAAEQALSSDDLNQTLADMEKVTQRISAVAETMETA